MALFDEPTVEAPKPRVAILGYGEESKSAYNYWIHYTDDVTICDADQALAARLAEDTQSRLGPEYLRNLDQFDVLVRSPALHPREIVAANMQDPSVLAAVTSNTNEFMRISPSKNIIAVTGTHGKSTTVSLIVVLLEALLKSDPATYATRVHTGGALGKPPLELLRDDIKPDDWIVLELDNHRTIDLKYSPPLAVSLMATPEDPDWHSDPAEFIVAGQQLFRWQQPDDIAIFYPADEYSVQVVELSGGQKIPYSQKPGAYVEGGSVMLDGQPLCPLSELKLPGAHNLQNICAAITAVWQLTDNPEPFRAALTAFTGLEHRLQFVKEIGGVKYYDDSFGATPATAIAALNSFSEPKVIILSGRDGRPTYHALADAVKRSGVKQVITVGEAGPRIVQALELNGFRNVITGKDTVPELVRQAQQAAASGDIVLLSTGCASFSDTLTPLECGEQFQKAVNGLPA